MDIDDIKSVFLRSLVCEATRAQILELQAQLGADSGVDAQASQSPSGLGPMMMVNWKFWNGGLKKNHWNLLLISSCCGRPT